MGWVELNWLHDGELLGRIGRSALAGMLAALAPFLARQGITLPDPSLSDTLYFAELAGIFRCQPIKVVAYFPPLLAAASRLQYGGPLRAGTRPPPALDQEERSIAAKVFELLTALDPDNRLRKAPLIKVFLLRFRQNLSRSAMAKACRCSESLVAIRLRAIEAKLPWRPQQLRELSAHVEAMEDAVSDSRARRIYRKGAAYGDEDGGGEPD